MMKAMRGHILGEPRTLINQIVTEVPVPEPQQNQVLVRVAAVGLNPDVELSPTGVYERVPFAAGGDASGIVEKVGPGVSEFQAGQRVYTCDLSYGGHYGEYMVVDAIHCFALPENLSFLEGAALPCSYFTAMRALTHCGNAKKGETVLIHGASGGVGLAAVQLASAMGLKVLGTAGSEAGISLIRSHGVIQAFNHRSQGYIKEIMNYTDENGVDLILEMAATDNIDKDCDLMAKNGRTVVINSRTPTTIDCRKLMAKESLITAVWLPDVSSHSPEQWKQMGQELNRLVSQGKCRPVIDTVHQMKDVGKAHEQIMDGKDGSKGKFVIEVQKVDNFLIK